MSHSKHIIRKSVIVGLSFAVGVVSTVFAAATYDANIQNRANTLFTTIKSNASKMDPTTVPSYYTLVRTNIASLIQVLTTLDSSIAGELGLSSLPGLDDGGLLGQITGTGNSGNEGMICNETTIDRFFLSKAYSNPDILITSYIPGINIMGQKFICDNGVFKKVDGMSVYDSSVLEYCDPTIVDGYSVPKTLSNSNSHAFVHKEIGGKEYGQEFRCINKKIEKVGGEGSSQVINCNSTTIDGYSLSDTAFQKTVMAEKQSGDKLYRQNFNCISGKFEKIGNEDSWKLCMPGMINGYLISKSMEPIPGAGELVTKTVGDKTYRAMARCGGTPTAWWIDEETSFLSEWNCGAQVVQGYTTTALLHGNRMRITKLGNPEKIGDTVQRSNYYAMAVCKEGNIIIENEQVAGAGIHVCEATTIDGYEIPEKLYNQHFVATKTLSSGKQSTTTFMCTWNNGLFVKSQDDSIVGEDNRSSGISCNAITIDGFDVPIIPQNKDKLVYKKVGSDIYVATFACAQEFIKTGHYSSYKIMYQRNGEPRLEKTACLGGELEGFSFPSFVQFGEGVKVIGSSKQYVNMGCKGKNQAYIISYGCTARNIGGFALPDMKTNDIATVSNSAKTITAVVKCNGKGENDYRIDSMIAYDSNTQIYPVSRNNKELKDEICGVKGAQDYIRNQKPITIDSDRLLMPIYNDSTIPDYRASWWGYIHYGEVVDIIQCGGGVHPIVGIGKACSAYTSCTSPGVCGVSHSNCEEGLSCIENVCKVTNTGSITSPLDTTLILAKNEAKVGETVELQYSVSSDRTCDIYTLTNNTLLKKDIPAGSTGNVSYVLSSKDINANSIIEIEMKCSNGTKKSKDIKVLNSCQSGYTYNSTHFACTKSVKVTLDCTDSTIAAGWYKNYLGRCGEREGIEYWNSQIPLTSESEQYNAFKYGVDSALGGKSKQEYLNGFLCDDGATYIKNTTFCKK